MKLYDSLTRQLRDFTPGTPPRVTVYGCGPTVYDLAHIGNFRTFVAYDLLHRHLRWRGFEVDFVVNLTDVDDKTIQGAAAAGLPLGEYTEPFVEAFLEDAATLGFLPFASHPRATAYIPEMVRLVEGLERGGHAYRGGDGSIYYGVASFSGYGRLSGKGGIESEGRSRIDAEALGKRDPRDFALWKLAGPDDEAVGAAWESPWGRGRPGWHLECSAMARSLVGETVDIHMGGEDLLFPHHENEIAQSEAATGRPLAHLWVHVRHLKVDAQKMSKSEGNFHTVRELVEEGYDPAAIRWALLGAHYRSELNFTSAGLDEATAALQRLLDFRRRVEELAVAEGAEGELADRSAELLGDFGRAMDDDLNVPRALAALWALVREGNTRLDREPTIGPGDRTALLAALAEMDGVLGVVELAAAARENAGAGKGRIQRLVEERDRARAARDFALADRIRGELAAEGIRLDDTPSGTRWRRVRATAGHGPPRDGSKPVE